ncbi:MAG: BlaI/MecI/CopY family transcriptional regulator [Lachnospiraceae bacterium]|nr:BlaI/MecI/CopY family transcriptional regulator [Lachnospiraceae bacterium]
MKELTTSELYVMKSIWDLGDHVRLANILEHVNETYHTNWKCQTVSTFLNKLVQKGYLESYRDGQYIHYRILISEEEYRAAKFEKEINFWNHGDIMAYAGNLFKNSKLTKKDITELQKTLEELKNDTD